MQQDGTQFELRRRTEVVHEENRALSTTEVDVRPIRIIHAHQEIKNAIKQLIERRPGIKHKTPRLVVDAHAQLELHLVLLEGRPRNMHVALAHTRRHEVLDDLPAHRQQLVDAPPLRRERTQDLVHEHRPREPASPDFPAALPAHGDIVPDDEDLDTVSPRGAGLLGREMEVEDVARVVLDDEDGARGAASGADGLDDLGDGGRGEDVARDGGAEEAAADEGRMGRFVAGAASRDEGYRLGGVMVRVGYDWCCVSRGYVWTACTEGKKTYSLMPG